MGITGVQKEAVLAAKRVIVTVEEIVDSFELKLNSVTLPGWVIDAVCVEPGGSYPSYALGYYQRDNSFYKAWDDISRERETFEAWMQRHVLGTKNFAEHTRSVAAEHGRETGGH